MGTLKPQSNGPLYSNTVIGTLTADGWAVTLNFDTARRGLCGLRPRPVPSSLYQMLQPTHQRSVYQLPIIRCGTIIASALYRVKSHINLVKIFAARCYASAAYAVMRCVCLSRSYILSKRINISSKNVSPSGSHSILVFHTKRHCNIPTGTPPPNGDVECRWR